METYDIHVVAWTRPLGSTAWYGALHFSHGELRKIVSPGTLIAVCKCHRCREREDGGE